MTDQRPNLYPIKGGIGKCVAFTALVERLAARDGKKIAVASGFPGMFRFHPQVAIVMESMTPEAITPVAHMFDNINFQEPYISNYCKGDRHILDAWARLYGLDAFPGGGMEARPDLYIHQAMADQARTIKNDLGQKFLMLQFTGGQPPQNMSRDGKYPENYLTQARNIQNQLEIMSAIGEAFREHLFLIYALPNEPVEIPAHLQPRVRRANAVPLAYAALLRDADSFVALDSSLQHFAAARQVNRKGVVMWGTKTTPEQIGYSFHANLRSTEKDKVVIQPKEVVDALHAIGVR